MGRTATLDPSFLKGKSAWYLSVPPALSKTGRRTQEYFRTRGEAEARARELKRLLRERDSLSIKATPKLVRDAVECNELAQIYGFSGLREAFLFWVNQHESKAKSIRLEKLIASYESDHRHNWSDKLLRSPLEALSENAGSHQR